MKGRGQERPLDFSLKSNMAWPKQLQTSHANLFIHVEKCLALISPPFLLRIPEIKCAKTLFEARPEGASNKRIFVYLRAL